MAFVPSQIPTPETGPDDPRVGHCLQREIHSDTQAVILGYPSDIGVGINGGRRGAAEAPTSIRRMLYRMTPSGIPDDSQHSFLKVTADIGDLEVSGDMVRDQEELGKVVGKFLKDGLIPIVLGGGHETSFGHFLGYAEAGKKVSIVNIDAHLDVRPLKDGQSHSGSPFRQALEIGSGVCTGYTVVGALPQSCAKSHVEYLKEKGGRIVWSGEATDAKLFRGNSSVMATFDVDAVDGAFAPGVSSPAVAGMNPTLFTELAYQAGLSPEVTSFDIVEMNPRFDRDNQTARLAALSVWGFLRGIGRRNA